MVAGDDRQRFISSRIIVPNKPTTSLNLTLFSASLMFGKTQIYIHSITNLLETREEIGANAAANSLINDQCLSGTAPVTRLMLATTRCNDRSLYGSCLTVKALDNEDWTKDWVRSAVRGVNGMYRVGMDWNHARYRHNDWPETIQWMYSRDDFKKLWKLERVRGEVKRFNRMWKLSNKMILRDGGMDEDDDPQAVRMN